jgi:DNA-binding transcriptional LysR family regulator
MFKFVSARRFIVVVDDMRTRTIRYVLIVCKEQSFTCAAARIGISQPTLSMAIKRLEKRLGLLLFERQSPVRLTPAGQALLPLFEQLDRCASAISRITKPP